MEDLVGRLAALRGSGKLADVFDKRPSKADVKRPGKAGFTMNCAPTMYAYSME
jgi:hypothetical protein